MINKNKLFRQIHIYISLFFLPLALLYALTGMAYILGFDQDSGLKENTYNVNFEIQEGKEKELVTNFLKENNIKLPKDEIMEAKDGDFALGSAAYSVELHQNEGKFMLITKERSFLGNMIMLHKNKVAWYFSVLGIAFGLTLLVLYLSGIMITLVAIKKDRRNQILTILVGFIVTSIVAYLSL
ncbi:PepSY-associated TM helix domain membrane protein [Campylobacter avium LMG 24591]|uniref:PepSY-associated TM helix domain membrane protein n=1 Tax=Campylobacter avium LMG 24591 TaxID=522484 RepID=A0A222MY42_9BACT|nr:hypothetical protein [Campylobacter avium]ASQ30648.1 PepSY-associated TM helix domain membrane protein [Campylobacter avium LMG 24591]OYD79744.1 PepSY-associated TM helix domain membrane protein [Campylobacter avium]